MLSLLGVSSIIFNNLSLKFNTVGLYQVFKLASIPVTVFIQTMFYGKDCHFEETSRHLSYFPSIPVFSLYIPPVIPGVTFSLRIKLALLVLLIGIGGATITDIELNQQGIIYGSLAVLFTAYAQIIVGSSQKHHGISGIQITHEIWYTKCLFHRLLLERPPLCLSSSYSLVIYACVFGQVSIKGSGPL
jgi:solute carrier family 35 protein E3